MPRVRTRRYCIWCGASVTDARVYFGVVGPFCNVPCREKYLASGDTEPKS